MAYNTKYQQKVYIIIMCIKINVGPKYFMPFLVKWSDEHHFPENVLHKASMQLIACN